MKKMLVIILVCMMVLTGCSMDNLEGTKIVFTTGFGENEIFRIEDITCTMPELMVYIVNMQNDYENAFGSEIWDAEVGEKSLAESVKDNCLARIAQVKTMNLLAEDMGVSLEESEEKKVSQAAGEYFSSLNASDITAMANVTQEEIVQLYREYALANKVYEYIIKDVNTEVSDDEARTISVEQIFFKTYTLDADKNKVSMTDDEKATVYSKAQSILSQIQGGLSFEEAMAEYNEADEDTISFGKGDMEDAYDTAAFNLDKDEISAVIEVSDGYVIIKSISTFNKENTEANKVKIVEKRKKAAFSDKYDEFVATLSKELNDELWETVALPEDESVITDSFFEVYDKYFSE